MATAHSSAEAAYVISFVVYNLKKITKVCKTPVYVSVRSELDRVALHACEVNIVQKSYHVCAKPEPRPSGVCYKLVASTATSLIP